MADPIDVAPAEAACCDSILNPACTFEDKIRARWAQVLCLMSIKNPSMFINVTIWRAMVISLDYDRYGDDQREVFVKIADNITVFNKEKQDKFYQQAEGLFFYAVNRIVLPSAYGVLPDDTIILPNNKAFLAVNVVNDNGMATITIESLKSRFIQPARTDPNYRLLEVGARIL